MPLFLNKSQENNCVTPLTQEEVGIVIRLRQREIEHAAPNIYLCILFLFYECKTGNIKINEKK